MSEEREEKNKTRHAGAIINQEMKTELEKMIAKEGETNNNTMKNDVPTRYTLSYNQHTSRTMQ